MTGGAGALGKAIATRLATDGARVALIDFRGDAVRPQPARIRTRHRRGCHAVTGDLADEESPRPVRDEAWQALGHADILVNAAGIYPSRLLLEMSTTEWDTIFAVNVRAPFLLTTEYARRWKDEAGSLPMSSWSRLALPTAPGQAPATTARRKRR